MDTVTEEIIALKLLSGKWQICFRCHGDPNWRYGKEAQGTLPGSPCLICDPMNNQPEIPRGYIPIEWRLKTGDE